MKKSDWGIEIRKVHNGFIIKDQDGNESVAREDENDKLAAAENLLHQTMEFFGLWGSRFDRERIHIMRVVGDKYEPREDEIVVKQTYLQVVTKKPKNKGKDDNTKR